MKISAKVTGRGHLLRAERKLGVLAKKGWEREAMRGVADAGRRTKTQVQKAVEKQMALKKANYRGYVVSGTRGVSVPARIAYQIFGVPGGQHIEMYQGLRVLKSGGKAAKIGNAGRSATDAGTVSSGVWNSPRIFKRSFETGGGYFAFLPAGSGGSGRAPKALWTYGHKPNQPRDAAGRFGKSGITYPRIRALFGPSLRKEIPKGNSLATFERVGMMMLEEKVEKRMARYLDF